MRAHLLLMFLVAILASANLAHSDDFVYVIVKSASIREKNQHFSKTVATVKNKDKLSFIKRDKGWLKVSFNDKEGWIHESALNLKPEKKKGFSLFGKDDSAKVSTDEVALAGKGFNEQVEKSYRNKNPKLDFAEVDKMEKITIADSKLSKFVTEGELKPRELEEKKAGLF